MHFRHIIPKWTNFSPNHYDKLEAFIKNSTVHKHITDVTLPFFDASSIIYQQQNTKAYEISLKKFSSDDLFNLLRTS